MMYCQNMCSTASRRGADRYFARCSSKRQALEYSFWLRLIGFACSEPCRSGLSELPAPRIFCADGAAFDPDMKGNKCCVDLPRPTPAGVPNFGVAYTNGL